MRQVLFFLEVLGSGYGSLLKAGLVIYKRLSFVLLFCFEIFFRMNQDICVHVYLWILLWFG